MKRLYLIIITGLFFCVQNIYSQLDTINNYYFSNLKSTLLIDSNVKEVKLIQEKILSNKAYIQTMYVKYKDDPDKRYWHVGKEFIYNTSNNKLGYFSNVDLKTRALKDTAYSYNFDGEIAILDIYSLKYDSLVPAKRGNNIWSGIFGNYYDKTPNFYKSIEYSCSRDTIIEKYYKYTIDKGFVLDGDLIYYNQHKDTLKKVKYVMGIEKPLIIIDKSRQGEYIDNRDGLIYPTIQIGNQVWLAKNLSYKPDSGKYWAWNNDINYISSYGYLYNWETAQNVCPVGWHLPTKDEFDTLMYNVGGADSKASHKDLFDTGNSGFSMIYVGIRMGSNNFSIGDCGLWSSTKKGWTDAFALYYCDYDPKFVMNGNIYRKYGLPVRCIKR